MFLWPCSLLFLDRSFLSPVSGFLLLVLGFSVGIPRAFSLVRHCFPFFLWDALACRGSPCALFFPSLYAFGDFVFFCLQLFFLYSIPFFFWFSYSSYLCLFGFVPFFSCLVSSSVPCRRVLRVCLQLRLRRRRVILLHFPLLWLLPLGLLSGFHLLLPFSATLLLLTGFRGGLVVPAR